MTAEQFQDWFEAGCSRGIYESDSILRTACVDVDAAFLALIVGDSDEEQLKEELANAVRPFEVLVSRKIPGVTAGSSCTEVLRFDQLRLPAKLHLTTSFPASTTASEAAQYRIESNGTVTPVRKQPGREGFSVPSSTLLWAVGSDYEDLTGYANSIDKKI
jgi:hypothetical protein